MTEDGRPGEPPPAQRPPFALSGPAKPGLQQSAQTIEFNVTVPPDAEKVVSYRVRYEWR